MPGTRPPSVHPAFFIFFASVFSNTPNRWSVEEIFRDNTANRPRLKDMFRDNTANHPRLKEMFRDNTANHPRLEEMFRDNAFNHPRLDMLLLYIGSLTQYVTSMILYFNLTRLRLMNFYQAMTNVQHFLSQEDLETLKLKDAAKLFDEKYKAFDAAVQPMRGNVDTSDLMKLDERRDKALVGLYGHVRIFTGFPEEAKATAAQQLLAILQKYDKSPQNKPLREETAIISNIVGDMEVAEVKAKLTLIGADKWLDELKEANTKFEATYNVRTQRNMDLVGQTKEKRLALDNEYRHLAHTINALAVLGGEGPYKHLMDSINADVQQAILAERPETKKKDPKQPKDPKDPKPKDPKDPKKPEGGGDDIQIPSEPPKKPDDAEQPQPGPGGTGGGGDDIHVPSEPPKKPDGQ
ncbi:hypothetical protein BHU11_06790 [Tannerella sp. oral taxon 808]|nr:hypothetical protein BHU11_06790 [Tannerella sp. oral taxon 808]